MILEPSVDMFTTKEYEVVVLEVLFKRLILPTVILSSQIGLSLTHDVSLSGNVKGPLPCSLTSENKGPYWFVLHP